MSDIFAKLFERDGKQALVTKETDEDGLPEVHLRSTTTNGHSVTLKFGYRDGEWDLRDNAFNEFSSEEVWEILDATPGMKL